MVECFSISPIEERLHPFVLNQIKQKDALFDVHCHFFNRESITDNYFHIRLKWLMKRRVLRKIMALLADKSITRSNLKERIVDVMGQITKQSQLQVASDYIAELGPGWIVCPLMMDMTQAFGQKTMWNMDKQLDAMKEVRELFPAQILPFVALDPNNPEMYRLFEKAFSSEYAFHGVKIYPSLGYLPSHPKLMRIFECCASEGIPVTTHCGGSATKSPLNLFDLEYVAHDSVQQTTIRFTSGAEKCAFFNEPNRWLPVLVKYPNLRLNFAHFGGDQAWLDTLKGYTNTPVHQIKTMMNRYEQVYADCSYLLHLSADKKIGFNEAFSNLFMEDTEVKNRILFGTDYYMSLMNGKISEQIRHFQSSFNEDLLRRMTVHNPLQFLNLSRFVASTVVF